MLKMIYKVMIDEDGDIMNPISSYIVLMTIRFAL